MQTRNEIYINTKSVSITTLEDQMAKWNKYTNFINQYQNDKNKFYLLNMKICAKNELTESNRIMFGYNDA